MTSSPGVAGFGRRSAWRLRKPVGLDHSHQQFPFLDLGIRRATVALDAVKQSPDTADFGGRWVVAIVLQHAVGVRRLAVHENCT